MSKFGLYYSGDPYGNRTHVNGVRGRCLNRLTNGPQKKRSRHLPIFTGRLQPTIFGTSELNFCVRNGNRWNLTVIDTGQCSDRDQMLLFWRGCTLKTEYRTAWQTEYQFLKMGSSPRPISTSLLNASRRLHMMPINLVVFKGSYLINSVGYLILRSASRLDAFSVYPIRT